MLKRLLRKAKPIVVPAKKPVASSNETYWTDHNVTQHARFPTPEASLAYFDWRNDQYPGYIDLMPVTGQEGKAVLDYGCGPGNDLVGFGHFSCPRRLVGMDVSTSSLEESKARLALHGFPAELVQIKENDPQLPLEDGSIDYVHSSGVIHHTKDPGLVLQEFRRVLRPGGICRVMVYNYDSIWLHLHVAYLKRIKEGKYRDLDIRSAFARTTDGENCPIVRVYTPAEFTQLATGSGFRCRHLGAALSLWELSLLPQRFEALMHPDLAAEHRKFLLALTLDPRGFPLYQGHYAGIDGCYELVRG